MDAASAGKCLIDNFPVFWYIYCLFFRMIIFCLDILFSLFRIGGTGNFFHCEKCGMSQEETYILTCRHKRLL
jgi:hypothetical protein